MARGEFFDANMDPELLAAVKQAAETYKKHKVGMRSGYSPRPKNPGSLHYPPEGVAKAIDVFLEDLATGRELPGIGRNAKSAQAYQGFANHLYQQVAQSNPALAKELYWGGYFKGGGWPQDYMHFQRGGTKPAGGDWKTGFSQEVMQKLGLKSSGGLDTALAAAGYTPEQRRNAIAAIESAGSGDYKALGAWTGGNRGEERGADRAYGRYQVMGSNIAPWAQQYLQMAGVTPEQFLADPALQDKLFDAVYGDYVKQYGERGAASKWFTGSEKEPDRTDANGKYTGKSYADMYMEQLTRGAVAKGEATPYPSVDAAGPTSSPTAAGPKKKGFWDKFASGMGDSAGPAVQSAMPYGASQMPPAAVASAEPVSMVNPEQIKQQREMLAQALAALQGSGYGQQQG